MHVLLYYIPCDSYYHATHSTLPRANASISYAIITGYIHRCLHTLSIPTYFAVWIDERTACIFTYSSAAFAFS